MKLLGQAGAHVSTAVEFPVARGCLGQPYGTATSAATATADDCAASNGTSQEACPSGQRRRRTVAIARNGAGVFRCLRAADT